MNNVLLKTSSIIFVSFLLLSQVVTAEPKQALLKPFTLAKIYKNSNHLQVTSKIKEQLTSAGFTIEGSYEPYKPTKIIIVTSPELLESAAKSKFGGFGAGIRVSITQVKKDVQVAHNNPAYMAVAYKMNGKLSSIEKKLANALGYVKNFGGKGISAAKLADYKYGVDLEGFNGFMDLAEYKSHKKALLAVEKNLEKQFKEMSKVYRIDIPGKKQTIFGVSLKNNIKDQKFLNDKFVMGIIDSEIPHRGAHLPYEIMVAGKQVMMMHPHFRIAVNFPDIRMFGERSFGKLIDLPYVYEEFFVQLAGGKWPIDEKK